MSVCGIVASVIVMGNVIVRGIVTGIVPAAFTVLASVVAVDHCS